MSKEPLTPSPHRPSWRGPLSALGLCAALLPTAWAGALQDGEALLLNQLGPQGKTFSGVAGLKLAHATVKVPQERGAVVIVNGRTENMLKYAELVAELAAQRYSVYLYDHRGQGFSDRLLPDAPAKGHVEDFEHYVDDLQTFMQQVVLKDPHPAVLALGHSMGGAVLTRHMQRFPGSFAAAALSSPMMMPNAPVPIPMALMCGFSRLTGGFRSTDGIGFKAEVTYTPMPFESKDNILTHSRARWEHVLSIGDRFPQTRLSSPTRHWAAEACRISSTLLDEAGKVRTPLLMMRAAHDEAVYPPAQDRFCEKRQQETGLACEGLNAPWLEDARHELLIETDEIRTPTVQAVLGHFNRHTAQPR